MASKSKEAVRDVGQHPTEADIDHLISTAIQNSDTAMAESMADQGDRSEPNGVYESDWVLKTNMYPSTDMDNVIHPMVTALREVEQGQDELVNLHDEHGQLIRGIEARQDCILEKLEQLTVNSARTSHSNEHKEDETVKVLKAAVKLLQEQQKEMKKQILDMKKKEPGEIVETDGLPTEPPILDEMYSSSKERPRADFSKDTTASTFNTGQQSRRLSSPEDISRRDPKGDHDSPIRRKIRDIGRENNATSYQTTQETERQISSLTRRMHYASDDIKYLKHDVDGFERRVQRGKDDLEQEMAEIVERINNLERHFVAETVEQRLNITRCRTFAATPTESLKQQIFEIWKALLQLEKRNNGEPHRSIESRRTRCADDDSRVVYWRDKLINASQCTDLRSKNLAFQNIKGSLRAMYEGNGHRVEHTPGEKGQSFLQRCVMWWETCYKDAHISASLFHPGTVQKRPAIGSESGRVYETDAKRLLRDRPSPTFGSPPGPSNDLAVRPHRPSTYGTIKKTIPWCSRPTVHKSSGADGHRDEEPRNDSKDSRENRDLLQRDPAHEKYGYHSGRL